MGFNGVEPGVWQVFLSSTARDFDTYRREVQDALLRKAEIACFLSEDWIGGFDDTVAKCKTRLAGSNGFVLLLGHWYGSIPPHSQRSITHLEFNWALERWRDRPYPPLAVMMPKHNSTADTDLRSHAARLIAEDRVDAAAHAMRLSAFHDEAKRSWRTITAFEDARDLRENVIVTCLNWKGHTPIAAARGQLAGLKPPSQGTQVTDEQLGRLGRTPQFDAVQAALAAVEDAPDAPALAFLLSGDDDAGQRVFVRHLGESALRSYGPRARPGSLPFQSADIGALVAWIAQSLGLRASVVQTVEALAELVAAELKTQPLKFSLHRIARLPGGIAAFQRDFWVPFFTRLSELRRAQQIRHRLVAVIVDYSGGAAAGPGVAEISSGDAPRDFTQLLLLPRFGPFSRVDVITWLQALDVSDEPAGRRAEIATRVLQNDNRESDAVPRRVFERLAGETLWPDEGSS